VPRAHLTLVTGPCTGDGVSCGPYSFAESPGPGSWHSWEICREPPRRSRHSRVHGWPLSEVGPSPVPRAVDSALGKELTSGPHSNVLSCGPHSFAESWVHRLSAQSLSRPPHKPSVPRAKAMALGTQASLPRALALALGTASYFFYFFQQAQKLPSSLIHHHKQIILITSS
jgi:hypothetical protein